MSKSAEKYRAMSLAYATGDLGRPKIKIPKEKKKREKKPKARVDEGPRQWPSATPMAREYSSAITKRTPGECAMKTLLQETLGARGVRFAEQVPILNYIADFYVFSKRTVIEVDGEYHFFRVAYDRKRTKEMNQKNIKVIRFTNHEVITRPDRVRNMILQDLFGSEHVLHEY